MAPAVIAASRMLSPPRLAARADDPAWIPVPVISDFRQWSPREDAAPSFRTEFQVAYDAQHLYVRVRAYDPHPDSIVRTVTRRDGTSASDEIGVYLSTTGDRRSGYEFYVNAAGVLRDVALSADVREDPAWNAVWDAAARVDSLGWIAEFRIPFSQLRFPAAARHQFGFLVNRVIQRRAERVSWPVYHPSRTGIVSQFGVLDALIGIDAAWTAEATPFIRSQNRGLHIATAAGADLRLGLGPNYGITATVLPDFGQVEADPAVVNLTTVETFYPEHRPFFLEDPSAFDVGFDCNAVNCGGEELFYSRRIGRAPQLAGADGVTATEATPILGAAKLTSRAQGGLTLGALAAATERVVGADGRTLEPATTYGVARVQHDFRDGQSGASLIATVVDRSLDPRSDTLLARTAIVEGGTFRHRFLDNQYELWGSATASRLTGSPPAIARVQRDPVHFLQRPGAALPFDATRTSLSGNQEEIAIGKYGGGSLMFETAYERESAGYDVNDLGYLQRADLQAASVWGAYITRTPRAFYKSWQWNVNHWDFWTSKGLRLENAFNSNTHVNLANNWWVNAGVTLGHVGGVLCDNCARGGPPMRSDGQVLPWLTIQGDPRRPIAPSFSGNWSITDGGRSHDMIFSPTVDLRVSARFQTSIGLGLATNHDDAQWFGNVRDSSGMHYTFAHVDRTTRSITLRMSYAATPRLSVESYAAPFASDGVYSNVRALSATPLAASYQARFVPFAPPSGTSTSFAVRDFRATTVLRWEYADGSTLFVVWSHQRDGSVATNGRATAVEEARQIFALRPINTVTVKLSYWMGR